LSGQPPASPDLSEGLRHELTAIKPTWTVSFARRQAIAYEGELRSLNERARAIQIQSNHLTSGPDN